MTHFETLLQDVKKDQVYRVRSQTVSQVGRQFPRLVLYQVRIQVWDQVEDQVRVQVDDQVEEDLL